MIPKHLNNWTLLKDIGLSVQGQVAVGKPCSQDGCLSARPRGGSIRRRILFNQISSVAVNHA